MRDLTRIQGVVTAVLTPVDRQGNPDLDRLERHLRQLERDGSDAVLMMGTTGEGPSFSVSERETVLEAAAQAAGKMQVMAQTGCASLVDTLSLTRHAFTLGLQAVTIMPPFFFKGVSDEGLYAYYSRVLDEAVPAWGKLMLYHIPQVTQVPISIRLVEMLLEKDESRIAGIKDSAGDISHLRDYCVHFPRLSVFTGNDQLILEALKVGAAGCVTGVVNLFAAMAGEIIRAFSSGDPGADRPPAPVYCGVAGPGRLPALHNIVKRPASTALSRCRMDGGPGAAGPDGACPPGRNDRQAASTGSSRGV